jgi:hypothetical protein
LHQSKHEAKEQPQDSLERNGQDDQNGHAVSSGRGSGSFTTGFRISFSNVAMSHGPPRAVWTFHAFNLAVTAVSVLAPSRLACSTYSITAAVRAATLQPPARDTYWSAAW